MKKYTLSANIRELVGRKVKNLRAKGLLPATVYGNTVKSVSVTVPTDVFMKLYKEAGETGLIELSVDKEVRPVLVHHVQVDPVKGFPIHIEFHQVDLKEKVTAQVPVELIGESPAVEQKLGVLLSVLDEVEVEALPTDLPENIGVNISILDKVNAEVKVADLVAPKGVVILTDPELTIVKIGSLITKEAEEQAAADVAAQAAAKAAEGTETPTEEQAETKEEAEPAKEE